MAKFNLLGGLGGGLFGGFAKSAKKFLSGTPDQMHQMSTLRPEQEGLYNQLQQAGQGPGAGGAFGQSADYYRGLLGNDSQDYESFAAPARREFSEGIAPQLAEQFAGMGSGGLSSSGFQNAQNQAGVDLSERLGQIRAQLRQSGAQGLQNIGQLGLGNFSSNYTQPGTPGFLSSLAPAIGTGIGMGVGGPIGAGIGNGIGNWFGGNKNNNASPLGPNPRASPSISQPGMSPPRFGGR